MKISRPIKAICAILLLAGCTSKRETPAEGTPPKAEKPPEVFNVKLDTSKGDVVIECHREWAPRGADRFYELVTSKFYDGARFFRVLPRFVVQWGINRDPATSRLWSNLRILDDPVKQRNLKGMVSYAMRGPATRTTQVFINMNDNISLDKSGFAPFGKVVKGMDVVATFYSAYGEGPPRGYGPEQSRIEMEGNSYLEQKFPRLDYIKTATVEK